MCTKEGEQGGQGGEDGEEAKEQGRLFVCHIILFHQVCVHERESCQRGRERCQA